MGSGSDYAEQTEEEDDEDDGSDRPDDAIGAAVHGDPLCRLG